MSFAFIAVVNVKLRKCTYSWQGRPLARVKCVAKVTRVLRPSRDVL